MVAINFVSPLLSPPPKKVSDAYCVILSPDLDAYEIIPDVDVNNFDRSQLWGISKLFSTEDGSEKNTLIVE